MTVNFKKALVAIAATVLFGCALQHAPGDRFRTDIWASGSSPFYKYSGEYQGASLYIAVSKSRFDGDEYGVLVKNGIVVKPISEADYQKILQDRANKLEAERQLVAAQKVDADRKAKAEAARKKAEREQCLSNGPIGICQESKKNQLVNLCAQNPLVDLETMGDPYCYYTDNNTVMSVMDVRNNMSARVRDVTFECDQIANSGTVLKRNETTIYDLWKPGETRTVKVKFTKHNQTNYIQCKAASWK